MHIKYIKKLVICALIFFVFMPQAVECQSLNILFVVDYFPAPGQAFILNIITGLIDRGHTVSIFAFEKKTIPTSLIPTDVHKYSLLNRVMYETLPTHMPPVDIVFCQSASIGKKILEMKTIASWLKGKKIVVALRGHDITNNEVKNDPSVYKRLFKECDLFLPVCHYFKNIAIALGCQPHKVIVHHSAIDCTRFFFNKKKKKKAEKIHLVSVSRLVEKKGLDIAIKAIAQVLKKHKNIHFTIVGRGRLRLPLERLAKKLRISDRVTFFGWATQGQVIQLLDQAHIFLSPSIKAHNGDEEGIANALKEAMAMGLISIGTWHAGTPELIQDGVSGFLVPQKNIHLLAQKIIYVIQHQELWKSIRSAARKKIENEFEMKKNVAKLERMFYTLLEPKEPLKKVSV